MPSDEELEKQKKNLLIEMNKLDDEIRKDRKKKFIRILLIIFIIVMLIKIFIGTIEINNIFGYPTNKARFYKFTINDKPITVDYNLKHKIPIIPFIVNFNSHYLGSSNVIDDKDGTYFYADDSDKYIIDISSYSCFSENNQIECTNENQEMKKNNDTKFKKLIITRTSNPYEEIYNGKFIEDITPYIKEKGVYCIQVIAKHSLVETEIYFYFKR